MPEGGVDAHELARRISVLPADLKVWFDGLAVLPRKLAGNLRRFPVKRSGVLAGLMRVRALS